MHAYCPKPHHTYVGVYVVHQRRASKHRYQPIPATFHYHSSLGVTRPRVKTTTAHSPHLTLFTCSRWLRKASRTALLPPFLPLTNHPPFSPPSLRTGPPAVFIPLPPPSSSPTGCSIFPSHPPSSSSPRVCPSLKDYSLAALTIPFHSPGRPYAHRIPGRLPPPPLMSARP
ncbi:hypothetical protein BDA96_09G027700 [Sorghum bicolor]|uniref:Uncharacterized protein n=1 Tax=Sorghum bicolor TaxID=4558 RepID=A0A921U3K7_SORBI|nr:hypothetical protein BDA96_09G027700 [Sorghum bicolor]